jgi:hypothetical protein
VRALSGFSGLAEPASPVDSGNGGTVTNMSQLTDATNTNGGVFTVQAGSYSGSIVLDGQDQKFNLAEGFQLAAGSDTVITVAGSAARIHLEGTGPDPEDAEFLGGMYLSTGANDIRLTNLKIATYNNESSFHDTIELTGVVRCLVERCDIRSHRYCFFNHTCSDLILCNSRIEGFTGWSSQSIFRTVRGTRVVCIDNFMRHPSHHSVRVHQSGGTPSDLMYVARQQLESSGGGGNFMLNDSADPGTDPQVNRIWYFDNTFYAGNMGQVEEGAAVSFVSSGNTFPGGGTGPAWSFQ